MHPHEYLSRINGERPDPFGRARASVEEPPGAGPKQRFIGRAIEQRLFLPIPADLRAVDRSLSAKSIGGRVKTMHPYEWKKRMQSDPVYIATDDEVLLTAQQVCARLGGISQMTLWRWLGSDAVRFPKPTMRVNKRRFWSAGVIRRWMAEHSSEELAA